MDSSLCRYVVRASQAYLVANPKRYLGVTPVIAYAKVYNTYAEAEHMRDLLLARDWWSDKIITPNRPHVMVLVKAR